MPQTDLASVLPGRCAASWTVDRHDCRAIPLDKLDHVVALQPALKRREPALVDERHIEALVLSPDIDSQPSSHTPKHARGQQRWLESSLGSIPQTEPYWNLGPPGARALSRKNPAGAGLLRIAGAGFEPATFGL